MQKLIEMLADHDGPTEIDGKVIFVAPMIPGAFILKLDDQLYFRAPDAFIADSLGPDEVDNFDVIEVFGMAFYPFTFLIDHRWFSPAQIQNIVAWCEHQEVCAKVLSVKWFVVEMAGKDAPEYINTIGITRNGDAFVAADSLKFPAEGVTAATILDADGNKFILLSDYKEACPEEFEKTVLSEVLENIAEQQKVQINRL